MRSNCCRSDIRASRTSCSPPPSRPARRARASEPRRRPPCQPLRRSCSSGAPAGVRTNRRPVRRSGQRRHLRVRQPRAHPRARAGQGERHHRVGAGARRVQRQLRRDELGRHQRLGRRHQPHHRRAVTQPAVQDLRHRRSGQPVPRRDHLASRQQHPDGQGPGGQTGGCELGGPRRLHPVEGLANEGIPASKVERFPIQPPDAAAAFATGKIDAWSTFATFFNAAVRNGAHVVALEKDIASDDVGVLAASEAVLRKNPAAFQTDPARQPGAHRAGAPVAGEVPERVPRQGADGPVGRRTAQRNRGQPDQPLYRVPTPTDRTRIHSVSQLFFANKSIDRGISVDEIVFDVDQAAAAQRPTQAKR